MYTGRGTVEKRWSLRSLVEFLRSTLQEISVGWKYFHEVSALWHVYFLYLKFQKTQSNSVKRVHVFAAHQMALFSKNKTKQKKNPKTNKKQWHYLPPSSFVLWQMAPEKMPDMGASKKKKKKKGGDVLTLTCVSADAPTRFKRRE